jgi:hypothetical protein
VTPEELAIAAHALVERTVGEQGLQPSVADVAVIDRIATLLYASRPRARRADKSEASR